MESSSRSAVSLLPPTLLDGVLSYVVNVEDALAVRRHRGRSLMDEFTAVASVSKEWHALLDNRASAVVLPKLTITAPKATRRHVLQIRRKMILRRAWLKRLVINNLNRLPVLNDQIWCTLLSHSPELELLALRSNNVVFPGNRAAEVIRAAADHCPLMQRLLLLPHTSETSVRELFPDENDLESLGDAVLLGIKAWASHGGLRHLQVPLYSYVASTRRSNGFVDAIAQYCPKIENLASHITAVDARVGTTSKEHWMLDLDTWEQFCRTCSHLTRFSWVCVPFATAFFEVFGRYSNPQLQKLTLAAPANWDWSQFQRDISDTTAQAVRRTGFAGSAMNAQAVLQACPNLSELKAIWYAPRPNERPEPKMNPAIFGDTFCETLATQCLKLTKLKLVPTWDIHAFWSRSNTTITDRSLAALARLPLLTSVEMIGINSTGVGLYTLLFGSFSRSAELHEYRIGLGDSSQDATAMMFYQALRGFLESLVAAEDEWTHPPHRVELQLINMKRQSVDATWSVEYLYDLRSLASQARRKYKWLRMSALVRGYDRTTKTFKRIAEFTVTGKPDLVPEFNDGAYEDEVADDPIDTVFANRTYLERRGDDGDDGARADHPDFDNWEEEIDLNDEEWAKTLCYLK